MNIEESRRLQSEINNIIHDAKVNIMLNLGVLQNNLKRIIDIETDIFKELAEFSKKQASSELDSEV